MGFLLFLVGFAMILLAILALLGFVTVQFGIFERILIFLGGLLLCVIGFVMARDRPESV